ncbi:MAG: hypothetical protein JKY67_15700 [Pseudomonadales bacterium]|nr:hypothetical protein [Pseudomonadales bacterium]MBL4867812.1 hypothetical protein [Pseudomonadales bacterium]
MRTGVSPEFVKIKIFIVMLGLFFGYELYSFVLEHSYFIGDDYIHFKQAGKYSLLEMMNIPIDVHFAPLHKTLSYLIFNISPLNYQLAIALIAFGWTLIARIVFLSLVELVSPKVALPICLIMMTCPLWINVVIWWGASAHRIPFLALYGLTLLFYLRFRTSQSFVHGGIAVLMGTVAYGFFVKSITIPVALVFIEICLSLKERRISKEGITVCLSLLLISMLYFLWYSFFSHVDRHDPIFSLIDKLWVTAAYVQRLGAIILFVPIDNEILVSASSLFWLMIAIMLIWIRPQVVIPIISLLTMLFIDNFIVVSGRGPLMGIAYMATMRYFLDEVLILGIFAALIIQSISTQSTLQVSPNWINRGKAVIISALLIYPVASYHFSKYLFKQNYQNHQTAHDFMINIERSYLDRVKSDNIKVLHQYLPKAVGGGFGVRQSTSGILNIAYPEFDWVEPENAIGKIHSINDTGNVGLHLYSNKIDFDDEDSFFGWYRKEDGIRWSEGKTAGVLFSTIPAKVYGGSVTLSGLSYGTQRLTVLLNGVEIAKKTITSKEKYNEWGFSYPPKLLVREGLNSFQFILPDAMVAGNGDARQIAIGVGNITIN